jgi:hypothetical protein
MMKLLPLDRRVEGSVVDRQGRPISGVTMVVVSLDHTVNSGTGIALHDSLITPAVTAAAGRFVIALPRDSGASLQAIHPRYFGGIDAASDSRVIGPIVLEPAGSITGRVTDAATGRPVARAIVGATPIEDQIGDAGSGQGEAVTDEQGRFTTNGLAPGVYTLFLWEVPRRPSVTARAVEGVRVRIGSDAQADLITIEGRPLHGIVIDRRRDQPVPGAIVECYGPARPEHEILPHLATTDDQGRFTFYVPPGAHYLRIMHAGRFGSRPPGPDDGRLVDVSSRLSDRHLIVPEQGEIELVRLQPSYRRRFIDIPKGAFARPGGPVGDNEVAGAEAEPPRPEIIPEPVGVPRAAEAKERPKAKDAASRRVTGRILDPRGRPLGGVRISVMQEAGDGSVPSVASDRDGVFILTGLPHRPVDVSLERSGYETQFEKLPEDRDRVEWTFRLEPDSWITGQAIPPRDEPIPPGLRGRLTFVELHHRDSEFLADGPMSPGQDLNRVPRGVHRLGETYFRIGEEMIHLRGDRRDGLPQAVKGIKVQARGRVLHFLQATAERAEPGTLVGAYVVHYADGSSERIPLIYGRNLAHWWAAFDPNPTEAKVAWTGLNDMIPPESGNKIRLLDLAWTNPHPEKEITALDMLSAGKDSDPFLMAMTVERGE